MSNLIGWMVFIPSKKVRLVGLSFMMISVFACGGSDDAFIYKVLESSTEHGVEITITWVVSHPGGDFRLMPGAQGISGQHIDPKTTVWGRISNTSDSPIRVVRAVIDEEGGLDRSVELRTSQAGARPGSLMVDLVESSRAESDRLGSGYFEIDAGGIRSFYATFVGTVSKADGPVSVEIKNIRVVDTDETIAITVRDIELPDIDPVMIDRYGNLPSRDFREPGLLRN